MTDGCYKEFIIESIKFIRNKDKKPTTESIFDYVKTKTEDCDLDLLKSSLETLLDDKIIENRPRKNGKSGESYSIVDNENINKNSDSKTESERKNIDSKANKPSTHINIKSGKCVCSGHKEIEQLRSDIFSIKTFFKTEIENLKGVFISSKNEESSSITFVYDRLVQHILEENKTKNDIFKVLAGNVSVNLNKSQSTDFSLQGPENDKANNETSMFSEEPRQKSIASIPKEPIKLNKGDTKNNHRTSQCQSSSLNSQNKTLVKHQPKSKCVIIKIKAII